MCNRVYTIHMLGHFRNFLRPRLDPLTGNIVIGCRAAWLAVEPLGTRAGVVALSADMELPRETAQMDTDQPRTWATTLMGQPGERRQGSS
jgi:hypothetical protein